MDRPLLSLNPPSTCT